MKTILFNDLAQYRERSGVGGYVAELNQFFPQFEEILPYSLTRVGLPLKKIMGNTLSKSSDKYSLGIVKSFFRTTGHDALERYFQLTSKFQKWDLYHEPDLVPLMQSDRIVATAHDLTVIRFPQWHPTHRINHYEKRLNRIKDTVSHFIADSEQTRTDLIDFLGIPAERITVVNLAPRASLLKHLDAADSTSTIAVPQKFILYSGNIEPRKNIDGLLTAYERLPKSISSVYPLILVGGAGWNSSQLLSRIESLKSKGVCYLGYLSDFELSHVLRRATVFVYPSFFEGFGLPPLEAMAAGVPVLSSHAGSLKEVVGDGALEINPNDTDSISSSLSLAIMETELRNDLIQRGKRNIERFDWGKTARLTREVYKRLL